MAQEKESRVRGRESGVGKKITNNLFVHTFSEIVWVKKLIVTKVLEPDWESVIPGYPKVEVSKSRESKLGGVWNSIFDICVPGADPCNYSQVCMRELIPLATITRHGWTEPQGRST